MKFERIDAAHPLFDASLTLYETSFPPNERRTRDDHLRALQDADFVPLGAVEDGRLLADIFLWKTDGFVYLEHFSVQPELRSHGTGGKILEQLLDTQQLFLLEIEPPEDPLTCRRKRFYERHGLQAQPSAHVQPLRLRFAQTPLPEKEAREARTKSNDTKTGAADDTAVPVSLSYVVCP